MINPLTPAAVSKLLEMIVRSTYVLACSGATASDSDINQTAGSLCENIDARMPQCVCCVQASRNAPAKSEKFLGEFYRFEFDPMGARGLMFVIVIDAVAVCKLEKQVLIVCVDEWEANVNCRVHRTTSFVIAHTGLAMVQFMKVSPRKEFCRQQYCQIEFIFCTPYFVNCDLKGPRQVPNLSVPINCGIEQ